MIVLIPGKNARNVQPALESKKEKRKTAFENSSKKEQKRRSDPRYPVADPFLLLKYKGIREMIGLKIIRYLEVVGRVVYVHTEDRSEPSFAYANLSELDSQLSNAGFIRISRFYIVPIKRIVSISGYELCLDTGDVFSVGRSYRKPLLLLMGNNKSYK